MAKKMENNMRQGGKRCHGPVATQSYCCLSWDQRNHPTDTHRHDLHMELLRTKDCEPSEHWSKPEKLLMTEELTLTNDCQEKEMDLFLEKLAHAEEQRIELRKKEVEQEIRKDEESKDRWRNLHYITLNQSLSKPWVSSYFKTIPMRIYSLPLGKRHQLKKKKMLYNKR